jgi:hypothetical protein
MALRRWRIDRATNAAPRLGKLSHRNSPTVASGRSPIAYRLGFKNLSAFNRLFKETCGVSPSEAREKAFSGYVAAPPNAENNQTGSLGFWLARIGAPSPLRRDLIHRISDKVSWIAEAFLACSQQSVTFRPY